MPFVDWIIVLAIALIAVAFFCGRRRSCRSLTDRARRLRGMRLLAQATIALWAALLTFERGFATPIRTPFGFNLPPRLTLGIALMLIFAGCQWSIRGALLLRQRRMFRTE